MTTQQVSDNNTRKKKIWPIPMTSIVIFLRVIFVTSRFLQTRVLCLDHKGIWHRTHIMRHWIVKGRYYNQIFCMTYVNLIIGVPSFDYTYIYIHMYMGYRCAYTYLCIHSMQIVAMLYWLHKWIHSECIAICKYSWIFPMWLFLKTVAPTI